MGGIFLFLSFSFFVCPALKKFRCNTLYINGFQCAFGVPFIVIQCAFGVPCSEKNSL